MRKNVFINVRENGKKRTFTFRLKERLDNLWIGYSDEFRQMVCFNKSTGVLSFEDDDIINDCYVTAVVRE